MHCLIRSSASATPHASCTLALIPCDQLIGLHNRELPKSTVPIAEFIVMRFRFLVFNAGMERSIHGSGEIRLDREEVSWLTENQR